MFTRRHATAIRLGLAALIATASLATARAEPPAPRPGTLLAAAATGDLARVTALIRAKTPLETRDADGRTALLVAVDRGATDIVRALVSAGADVNAVAANKDTPWLLAGVRGHADMLTAMIPAGPDLARVNRYGGSALIPACERGHVEAIKVLLTTKTDVDLVNSLGWTCLLEIVVLGDGGPRHVEATRLVLAAGADPNIADRNGVTPLRHARQRGQADIARLIEAAGGR